MAASRPKPEWSHRHNQYEDAISCHLPPGLYPYHSPGKKQNARGALTHKSPTGVFVVFRVIKHKKFVEKWALDAANEHEKGYIKLYQEAHNLFSTNFGDS